MGRNESAEVCFVKLVCAILLTLFLSGLGAGEALAYKMPDKALLQAAEVYAVTHRNLDWDAFLAPWTVYEEKSPILKPPAERAVVYTPFLLVAMEKKQALQQNQALGEAQIAGMLKSYEGHFVLCVILRGSQPGFTASLAALVQQGSRQVKPHYVHADAPAPIAPADTGAPAAYEARVYFYFPQGQVDPDSAAGLLVFEQGQNARRYALPLAGMG